MTRLDAIAEAWKAEWLKARRENADLRARITAALAIHPKNEVLHYCQRCGEAWPCETVRALAGGSPEPEATP